MIAKAGESTREIGIAGARWTGGTVYDDDAPNLSGDRGRRIFRRMREQDPIIGAAVTAIENTIKAVDWRVEPADDSPQAEERSDWLYGALWQDMSHAFDAIPDGASTMITTGWAAQEIVWKRRIGPDQRDPAKRSRFSDGYYAPRKIAPRSQYALDRWEMDETGGVQGLWQYDPNGIRRPFIPIERLLLYRTTNRDGSPEGRSMLKGAYDSWRRIRNYVAIEGFGIERDLAGLPIVTVPSTLWDGTAESNAAMAKYEELARKIKRNENGGIVLPSDTYSDADGKPTNIPIYDIKLLSAAGARQIDTSRIIEREYTYAIRAMLADFIMLGTGNTGTFAMAETKLKLFVHAIEHLVDHIASVLNAHLVPRIWAMNGFPRDLMPFIAHGEVQPIEPEAFAAMIRDLAGAGLMIDDAETENAIRSQVGLPEVERTLDPI